MDTTLLRGLINKEDVQMRGKQISTKKRGKLDGFQNKYMNLDQHPYNPPQKGYWRPDITVSSELQRDCFHMTLT